MQSWENVTNLKGASYTKVHFFLRNVCLYFSNSMDNLSDDKSQRFEYIFWRQLKYPKRMIEAKVSIRHKHLNSITWRAFERLNCKQVLKKSDSKYRFFFCYLGRRDKVKDVSCKEKKVRKKSGEVFCPKQL